MNTNPHNTNPHNTNPHNTNPHNTNPHNTNPHNTNPHNTMSPAPRATPTAAVQKRRCQCAARASVPESCCMRCVGDAPVGAGYRRAHVKPSGGCEVSPHSALKGRVDARGTRSVDSRWAVSYLLAQCQVELRSRTERLSTESVWPLELPQCIG